MELQVFKDKCDQTNMKKYGVKHIMKLQFIKDKREQTNIKRYGVSSSIKLQIFKDKREQTCLKKYGVKSVPCVIITMNDYVIGRIVGSNITEDAIRKMFN